MFDFGFWELVVVLVVALVVVGPERLPQLARTAGLWMGRMRRMVDTVRADIQRELEQEELKKSLTKDGSMQEIKQMLDETENDFRRDVAALERASHRELIEEVPEASSKDADTSADPATPIVDHPIPPAADTDPAPATATSAGDTDQPRAENPTRPDDHRDGTHGGNG
ncbi:MAG: Sec-independent protein translocase protein TatB [Gammaproteobacteria bacterium]